MFGHYPKDSKGYTSFGAPNEDTSDAANSGDIWAGYDMFPLTEDVALFSVTIVDGMKARQQESPAWFEAMLPLEPGQLRVKPGFKIFEQLEMERVFAEKAQKEQADREYAAARLAAKVQKTRKNATKKRAAEKELTGQPPKKKKR